jgi:hypothetical protein
MAKGVRLALLMIAIVFLAGCAGKIPHALVPDFSKKGMRLVAVLPIANGQEYPTTASLLRPKLVEELYFKGYPRVPLKWIDERLSRVPVEGGAESLSPQRLGEMLNVDALLYTTLKEGPGSVSLLYSTVAIDAEFELKSAKTGESLWRVRHRTVYRNFGFTKRSLVLKASQVYETAIDELLGKVLETLPDGPDAAGA